MKQTYWDDAEDNPVLDALGWRLDDYNFCPETGCNREIDQLTIQASSGGLATLTTECFDGHIRTVQVYDP